MTMNADFPMGSYVRNPPTSNRTPGSAPGCTIFVKLWQFGMADRAPVNVDMTNATLASVEDRGGVSAMVQFEDVRETVRLEQWAADLCPGRPTRWGRDIGPRGRAVGGWRHLGQT